MSARESKKNRSSELLRERLDVIASCAKLGESLKSYADRHGVSVYPFYQAKKIARQRQLLPPHRPSGSALEPVRKARPPRFVEVRPASTSQTTRPTWRLRFPGGEVLESDTPLRVEEIVQLAQQFRSRT